MAFQHNGFQHNAFQTALPGGAENFVDGDGSSSGTSTADAVGASIWQATASSAGIATDSVVGAAIWQADASAAGTSAADVVGASIADAVASSVGTSTADATGAALFDAAATSAGTSTATATGAATWDAVATSAGVGAADAVGEDAGSGTTDTVGTADGSSEVLAVGASTAEAPTEVGGSSGTWTRPSHLRKLRKRYRLEDGTILTVETVRDAEQLIYAMLAGEAPELLLNDVPAPDAEPPQPKRRKGKAISQAAVKRAAARTPQRTPFDWMAEPARAAVVAKMPPLGPVNLTEAVAEARKAVNERKAAKEARTKRNRRVAMAMMQMMAEL